MRRFILHALLAFLILLMTLGEEGARADTITVGLDSCDYTDIQTAINSANSGDIVEVRSGTYYENVVVDKQLTITGVHDGDYMPVLDAEGKGTTISLYADNITLKGFVIRNSGFGKAGVDVESDNNFITGNQIVDNRWYGINIRSESKNNKIYQNKFVNNGHSHAFDRGTDNDWDGNSFDDFYERASSDGFYKILGGSSIDKRAQKIATRLEANAFTIHQQAWQELLDKAESDLYYKYAIYASRTLAVKHPEVYLRGDGIFAEVLTTTPGLKDSYETEDVHSEYFYKGPGQLRGNPFSFKDVDFGEYAIIGSLDIYPIGYPCLDFLDRRLAPLATSLKTHDHKITPLEVAEKLYFEAKMEGAQDLFLIYCENDNAYLYRNGVLISTQDQEEVEVVEGDPILIFNEERVWYPLMGRDDTEESELLADLVQDYSTTKEVPELTDFESDMLERLIEVTELENDDCATFAELVSISHSWTLFNMLPPERSAELRGLERWLVCPHWRAWLEKAALLSPISAYLAAIAGEEDGLTGIEAMLGEYQKYAATSGSSFAHGHVWQCGMYEGGPEHSYRTHGGHCVVQSGNMGAVLELAGIDHYRLAGVCSEGDHHDFLYLPDLDLVVSNSEVRSRGGTVLDRHHKRGSSYTALDFVEHEGLWGDTCFGGRYWGTLPPEEALEIITSLRGVHGEDIGGAVTSPGIVEVVSFEELEQLLLQMQQDWFSFELPDGYFSLEKYVAYYQ